jgi:hypothetical protein
MYRAELHPSKYDYTRTFLDSTALRSMLDRNVALLQQLSETQYQVTFTHMALGERKHVRIRYLLPNTGGATAAYSIPVLFYSAYRAAPKYIKLTVLADSTDRTFALQTASGQVMLTDSSSNVIPFTPSVQLTYARPAQATVHSSQLADGPMAGNYLLVNTTLTDTLVASLSNSIETVFIWRWNGPHNMIAYDNQVKTLSGYARGVITQAQTMAATIQALNARGYRTGLIHSIEGEAGTAFTASLPTDSANRRLLKYLEKFNAQYLYTTYNTNQDIPADWIPNPVTQQSRAQKTVAEFRAVVRQALAMYSTTPFVRKHFVVVSAGEVDYQFDLVSRPHMDSLLVDTNITMDASPARWGGIDFNVALRGAWQQGLSSWGSYLFPAFEPSTVELKIVNPLRPYSFPLSVSTDRQFAVVIKTSEEFLPGLQWTGYDVFGKVTNVLSTTPLSFATPQDSGLAKIWARDGSHVCDREEDLLGARYGIVTKATFLRASIEDQVALESDGVPFLDDEEIHVTPVRPKDAAKKNTASLQYTVKGGMLSFTVPAKADVRTVEFFNLRGRLVLSLELSRFRLTDGSFSIPLRQLLPSKAAALLIARVKGSGYFSTFTFNFGGVQ